MNRIILPLLAALFFVSCYEKEISGNGNIIKEKRELNSFTAIEANQFVNVYCKQGIPQSIEIEADENLLHSIKTKVSNGTLKIGIDGKIKLFNKINVYITAENLSSFNASGASSILLETPFFTDKKMKLKTTGASSINGVLISSGKIAINTSGASKIEATISCKNLSINATGFSNIMLKGNAESKDINVKGATNIHLGELTGSEVMTINAKGAANIVVKKGTLMDLNTSGSVSIITID